MAKKFEKEKVEFLNDRAKKIHKMRKAQLKVAEIKAEISDIDKELTKMGEFFHTDEVVSW